MSIGVDLIDLKDPGRGALAATSPEFWNEVADRHLGSGASSGTQWSVALGESSEAIAAAALCPPEFNFAKAGPADCSSIGELRGRWDQIRDQLPSKVELVAVAYSDAKTIACPLPVTILEAAAASQFRTILLDTRSKCSGDSVAHLGLESVKLFVQRASHLGLQCIIAGGLNAETAFGLPQQGILPNGFGFRGAACGGDRQSTIQADLVRELLRRRDQLMQTIQVE